MRNPAKTLVVAAMIGGSSVGALHAHADGPATEACSIKVDYTRDNVNQLSYLKDFQVSANAAFSEDFSTPTRQRSFDATLSNAGQVPVVSFVFDADVSPFDTVDVTSSLKVQNSNGDTTSGTHTFWTQSVPVNGVSTTIKHATTYTLSCRKVSK